MAVFAVTTAKGANWDRSRGIREQPFFEEHGAFADALVDRGVIIIGGPVASEDADDIALLAVECADEPELRSVFDDDPWIVHEVFRLKDVRPWTLLLDGRSRRAEPDEGLRQLLQAGAGEQVAGGYGTGGGVHEVQDGGPGCLRGEQLAHLPDERLLGLAVARRVGRDPGLADVSVRGHPRHDRGDGDVEPGAARLAAPLLITTTLLPGGSGLSSASRSQLKVIFTSVCQFAENVSHVCRCSGRGTGLAPATRMRTCGSYLSSRTGGTAGSAASATSVLMFGLVAASSSSARAVLATAITGAPAAANALAIPRPSPLLAPTTTIVLADVPVIVGSPLRCSRACLY
jgi:uncharacterized protein